MLDDTRTEQLEASLPKTAVFGCELKPSPVALTAAALKIDTLPGVLVIEGHAEQHQGRTLTPYSGSTLSASSQIYALAIAYFLDDPNGTFVAVVDGDEALTTVGATAPDDDAVDAYFAAAGFEETPPWTALGLVLFQTTAGSVVSIEEIDHTVRSFGVPLERKDVAAAFDELDVVDADRQIYRPWGSISVPMLGVTIADGDLVTDLPLPLIYGRIKAWRTICTAAVTTAAKGTTPHLDIGATTVTGSDGVAKAGTEALGAVETLGAPTALNTFKPGDVFSIVAASTTAYTEGSFLFQVDIEELITI